MLREKEVPVYLFTGFLESGKTKFIQETLEDEKFNPKDRTLLLVCEEGEEEYNKDKFVIENVFMEIVNSPDELKKNTLSKVCRMHKADRVVIEYNGMWNLSDLYENLPDNWVIYQQIFFADSETFISYNNNMRQLMVDKLNDCELVALNRATDKTDKEQIHKIIRGINRRTQIIYEYLNGEIEYDNIEDPLPFDVNAPIITIEDKDYAIWYRDLMEEPSKYDGRTVKFKGMVARPKELDEKGLLIGRRVMTCCADDIAFRPIACESDEEIIADNAGWYTITARIIMKQHKLYTQKAPVLVLTKIEKADAPTEEVATFY